MHELTHWRFLSELSQRRIWRDIECSSFEIRQRRVRALSFVGCAHVAVSFLYTLMPHPAQTYLVLIKKIPRAAAFADRVSNVGPTKCVDAMSVALGACQVRVLSSPSM
jgi:hypothetical protein